MCWPTWEKNNISGDLAIPMTDRVMGPNSVDKIRTKILLQYNLWYDFIIWLIGHFGCPSIELLLKLRGNEWHSNMTDAKIPTYVISFLPLISGFPHNLLHSEPVSIIDRYNSTHRPAKSVTVEWDDFLHFPPQWAAIRLMGNNFPAS